LIDPLFFAYPILLLRLLHILLTGAVQVVAIFNKIAGNLLRKRPTLSHTSQ
jgi:hypothetical protein